MTFDELQAAHARLQQSYADVMAEGGSYRALQVRLDAALQKHQDDAAVHAAALTTLQTDHAAHVQALRAKHAAALEQHADALAERHAAAVAQLKAEVLVPALQDLHARQQADLAAQHAADLAKLSG